MNESLRPHLCTNWRFTNSLQARMPGRSSKRGCCVRHLLNRDEPPTQIGKACGCGIGRCIVDTVEGYQGSRNGWHVGGARYCWGDSLSLSLLLLLLNELWIDSSILWDPIGNVAELHPVVGGPNIALCSNPFSCAIRWAKWINIRIDPLKLTWSTVFVA